MTSYSLRFSERGCAGKKNKPGITKLAILNYLEEGPHDEYEIRERLISEFPDIFCHRTDLHQIKRIHLKPLEEKGWIRRMVSEMGDTKYEQTGEPRHFTADDIQIIKSRKN